MNIYRRNLSNTIAQSLRHFPAVLILGARQVGKSTLVKQCVIEGKVEDYATLDDANMLSALKDDPDGFLSRYSGRLALDEIQRVPDLMRALKKHIDADRQNGRFLLTGSANVLAHPEVSESLAGRMDVILLEGLALNEILSQPSSPSLVELLFTSDQSGNWIDALRLKLKQVKSLEQSDLLPLILLGGYPNNITEHDFKFTQRWFSAYETSYIERDVRDLTKSIDMLPFRKLLYLCGLRTGNLLNIHQLGADIGIDQRTAQRYLGLLELTFQVRRLFPWFTNNQKQLVKTPKIYLNDSGYACYMAGIHATEQLRNSPLLGSFVETWVFAELRKQFHHCPGLQAYFFRTHQGHEVDFVLNYGLQQCGIEVKWSSQIDKKDIEKLKRWQDLNTEPTRAIILYTGHEVVAFSDTLVAIPFSVLG